MKRFLLIIVLGVLVSIPIILPYFNNAYFPTHDGEWAVVRAAEMFRELKDFQFPPRFSQALNFGYGYPLFNFAYPGPYYMTTLIHGMGLSFITSVKILFAVTVPLSFYGMYFFSSAVFKKRSAGIISAILYIFLPYRMVDLYVRGNIGESLAFALFPFIFWCLYKICVKKTKTPYILLGTVFIFLLIISHNIMSIYLGILSVSFLMACIFSKKFKEALLTIATLLWGGLLSAYFIVPALFEKQFIKLSEIPIADRNLYFVTLEKLFISPWGYGTPTDTNAFPYLIGGPQLAGVLSVFTFHSKKTTFEKSLCISFLITLLILIFMMFSVSQFFWQIPLLSEINYPWTLLLPIGFLASFLSGSVSLLKKGSFLGVILILISIFLYLPFARPSGFIDQQDSFYITNEATTTSSQELMPLWVKEFPMERYVNKVELTGENYASNIQYSSKEISFVAEMKNSGPVTVNTIFYPGWRVYVNNSPHHISYENKKGLMVLELPKGTHDVVFYFSETPLRIFSNSISVISGILLCASIVLVLWRYKIGN